MVMHILEPFCSRFSAKKMNMDALPATAIWEGSETMKKIRVTTEISMLSQVKLTIPFLLPLRPTYQAPRAAQKMEGNILIVLKVVEMAISPMMMPKISVLTTDWLPKYLS